MSYEAMVFFLWLHQTRGPTAIIPFLREMAPDRSSDAQIAALERAISARDWLRFAQDYLDLRIRHPAGGELQMLPHTTELLAWSRSETQTRQLPPFVIRHMHLEFACGRWSTSATPSQHHAVRAADDVDQPWGELPASIDTQRDQSPYLLVGFNATDQNVDMTIRADRTASCCVGTAEVDACVVGAWNQVGGGVAEWMQRNYRGVVAEQAMETRAVYKPDGSYALVGALRMKLGTKPADALIGDNSNQQKGTWSARDGWLHSCPEETSSAGEFRHPKGSLLPFNWLFWKDDHSFSYRCTKTTLQIVIEVPGFEPIVTEYARQPDETKDETMRAPFRLQ